VADTGNRAIRKITLDGTVSTVYQLPSTYNAVLDKHLAVDKLGNLYLSVEHAILKIVPGP
jgi:hypothetical protein